MSVMFSSMKTGHFRATLTQSKALTQPVSHLARLVGSLAVWLAGWLTVRLAVSFYDSFRMSGKTKDIAAEHTKTHSFIV